MTRKGYGESTGKIILIGEHAVTFGEPAIAVPFNAGKIKVLIEALESGNYSSIKSDVYDGMLYDAPDHLKSLVNRFVELNNITEPLAVTIKQFTTITWIRIECSCRGCFCSCEL